MYRFSRVVLASTTKVGARRYPSIMNGQQQFRHFSSADAKPGMFGRITDAFQDRQKRKHLESFQEQVQKMCESDVWTINDFQEDLDKSVNTWMNKLPGMSSSHEIKVAKETHAIVKAVMDQMGADATCQDLETKMSRTDKLKISLASGMAVEDINLFLQQFQSVDIMHAIVRRRHAEGKTLPSDPAAMKQLMQTDGLKVLTKAQRKSMMERQQKKFKSGLGLGRGGKKS